MDEIFDERKSEYIYKYSDLLDSYINFVKESNSIGNGGAHCGSSWHDSIDRQHADQRPFVVDHGALCLAALFRLSELREHVPD